MVSIGFFQNSHLFLQDNYRLSIGCLEGSHDLFKHLQKEDVEYGDDDNAQYVHDALDAHCVYDEHGVHDVYVVRDVSYCALCV